MLNFVHITVMTAATQSYSQSRWLYIELTVAFTLMAVTKLAEYGREVQAEHHNRKLGNKANNCKHENNATK